MIYYDRIKELEAKLYLLDPQAVYEPNSYPTIESNSSSAPPQVYLAACMEAGWEKNDQIKVLLYGEGKQSFWSGYYLSEYMLRESTPNRIADLLMEMHEQQLKRLARFIKDSLDES